MIDKRVATMAEALAGLGDGASVMMSGFGGAGFATELVQALEALPARDLTVLVNSLRSIEECAPRIFGEGRVVRGYCSGARSRGTGTSAYEKQWLAGTLAVDLLPQGTFAERIRAGGAGIPAFYTPAGVGTALTKGRETREFDGRLHVLETALKADFALIRGQRADRWGNVAFRGTQLNFAPAMAAAARTTVVQVAELLDEPLDPHAIDIPGIYVDRVIAVAERR